MMSLENQVAFSVTADCHICLAGCGAWLTMAQEAGSLIDLNSLTWRRNDLVPNRLCISKPKVNICLHRVSSHKMNSSQLYLLSGVLLL